MIAAVALAATLTACAETAKRPILAPPMRTTTPPSSVASPIAEQTKLVPSRGALPVVPSDGGLARVALLLPLSGPSASVGEALLDAAQMALFDVADGALVLQVYDSHGTPEETAKTAEKAIAEGAQLILGPVFAADARAAAPVAAAHGVNIVTFSTDSTVAAQNVFVLGFLVQEQVREIVSYARSQGHTRFALLAPETAYGEAVTDAFNRIVPAHGGQIVHAGSYAANGDNLESVMKQITNFDQRKRALGAERARLSAKGDTATLKTLEQNDSFGDVDFDALLLPDQGARLTRAANLLSFYDVDLGRVQLLGTLLWNMPNVGQEPALVGGLFPAPSPEGNHKFQARYREIFGHAPLTIASHGYDAVALAAALARSGMAQPFSSAALTSPSGFAGVDGIFRFLPDGLSERSFAIMQVTKDGPVLVHDGATTFTGAGL
jgi:ABC-type branched-subunit amino acid transport system substrate-binding protein